MGEGGQGGEDPDLAAYRAWALDRYRGLSLIGLGAADVRMRFEVVYVPLRIARRPGRFEMEVETGKRPGRGLGAAGSDEIEIEEIFATGVPHSLVLGHPGAGKTTSLLKLLHLCLAEGPKPRSLAEGTVPVLLRLRHLTAADLDRPLADFAERELAETSGGALPAGLGTRLWDRGRLLLLLDGLDEIADEALRTRVCGFLDFALTGAERRHIRAILSCRFAGYGGRSGSASIQEYLTALHIASQGAELLGEPCARCGDEWWHEVLLLVVGLPGRRLFGPLMERLLAVTDLPQREDLLRACLDEAAEVDLEPLLSRLVPEEPPQRLAVVLRLLRGRSDPRLLERVTPLIESTDAGVAALARQIAAELSRPAAVARPVCDLFVVHHPADGESAFELVRVLRRAGRHVLVAGEDPLSENIAEGTTAVAVLAGPSGRPPWEVKDLYRTLRLFTRRRRPLVPVRLPGAGTFPAPPGDLPALDWVDLRQGLARAAEALELALEKKPAILTAPPAGQPSAEPGRTWIEPVTGIRFLWIPGGRFQMGGNRFPDEQPVHWVRVSPFWLGETPVTNQQYALFLDQTRYREPDFWRDRRFSAPEQPVVGVSWEDAEVFCAWLARVSGKAVVLPSEAQWEFAARGPDAREYPWGNAAPGETLACFDLDFEKGQPAPVGSYPEGRGPFGTLDQAGNVWEWCLDVWDEKAYQKRAKGREPLDPVVSGEGEGRVLRGGGCFSPAENLRAAYRDGSRARFRDDDVGFRVAAAPASTLKP